MPLFVLASIKKTYSTQHRENLAWFLCSWYALAEDIYSACIASSPDVYTYVHTWMYIFVLLPSASALLFDYLLRLLVMQILDCYHSSAFTDSMTETFWVSLYVFLWLCTLELCFLANHMCKYEYKYIYTYTQHSFRNSQSLVWLSLFLLVFFWGLTFDLACLHSLLLNPHAAQWRSTGGTMQFFSDTSRVLISGFHPVPPHSPNAFVHHDDVLYFYAPCDALYAISSCSSPVLWRWLFFLSLILTSSPRRQKSHQLQVRLVFFIFSSLIFSFVALWYKALLLL